MFNKRAAQIQRAKRAAETLASTAMVLAFTVATFLMFIIWG